MTVKIFKIIRFVKIKMYLLSFKLYSLPRNIYLYNLLNIPLKMNIMQIITAKKNLEIIFFLLM